MRALFPRLLHESSQLQTAYSIDSVLIEIMFIFGPLLVAVFVAQGYPGGAIMLAALTGAIGGFLFMYTPAIRDWKTDTTPQRRDALGPLRYISLRKLFTITFLYSTAFGLFEIAVTAFAIRAGRPAAAGTLLALASMGSALGALVYGSHDWRWSPHRQFIVVLMLMALGILLLIPVSNVYGFGALCVLACMPMASVLAVQAVVTSRIAPPAMAAESFTWGATCLLAGLGAGTTVGGILVEQTTAGWALGAAATMTGFSAGLAWLVPNDQVN
jgi:predicted MFS family arabinose efflux permease